jgi:hypothetical protein
LWSVRTFWYEPHHPPLEQYSRNGKVNCCDGLKQVVIIFENAPSQRYTYKMCLVNNETSHITLVLTHSNSVPTISCLFPFIFQNWKNASQPSEIFGNFSKWWNRQNDNGRQAETAGRHRIPFVRMVWRWQHYAPRSKCILSSFGV